MSANGHVLELITPNFSGILTSGKKGLLAAIDGINNPDLNIESFDDARALDIQNEKRPAERGTNGRKRT